MRALFALVLVLGGVFAATACGPDDSGSPAGANAGGGGAGAGSGGGGAGGAGGGGGEGGGGGGGEGGGGIGPILPGQECDAYGKAFCLKWKECKPFALDVLFLDFDTCAARIALTCKLEEGLPGSTFDAAKRKACVEAYVAATCDDVYADKRHLVQFDDEGVRKGADSGPRRALRPDERHSHGL
jgi:hypothetical protein